MDSTSFSDVDGKGLDEFERETNRAFEIEM
jgi:hypothetical protein